MTLSIRQGLFQFDLIDHYAILGVSVNAQIPEIRQRYLKIAYKIHPDTCKAKTRGEQEMAEQMLSKMVNPAYEILSKEQSRGEFRLIIGQIGRGVSQDLSKITIASEPAKKLSQSTANIDQAYQKLLQGLAIDQYNNFDTIMSKIAQISELNLVYLMLTEEENVKKSNRPYTTQQVQGNTTVKPTSTSASEDSASNSAPRQKETQLSAYIRRAQEQLDKDNPAQALRELRDALRQEPENSVCHALLGLAYLRQNQTSMAKVHINRAWQTDKKNPIVIKCKKELDKVVKPTIEMGNSQDEPGTDKKGGFWSRFGGKKK